MNIGFVASEVRTFLGMSLDDVASKTGLPAKYIHDVECGSHVLMFDTLWILSHTYGIDLYVYAWCKYGDVEQLPERLRPIAAQLTAAWNETLEQRRHDNVS